MKQTRREKRIQKAQEWLMQQDGKHIVKKYRKKTKVDIYTALRDLEAAGYVFAPGQLENIKRCEMKRVEALHKKKKEKHDQEWGKQYEDYDDTYAFIAGYTSNGVAYGTTWEELGLEPYATQEEIDAAYGRSNQMIAKGQLSLFDEEEFIAIESTVF